MQEENNIEPTNNRKVWLIGAGLAVVVLIVIVVVLGLSDKSSKPVPSIDNQEDINKDTGQIPVGIMGRAYVEPIDDVRVGDEVEATVKLNTDDTNINLARIYIRYDTDLLEYIGFDGSNSVLGMSLRDDSVDGTIIIARGAPGDANVYDSDDGFTGEGGLFGGFKFKALKSGFVNLALEPVETKIFLDNGLGTKMDIELEGTEFEIK